MTTEDPDDVPSTPVDQADVWRTGELTGHFDSRGRLVPVDLADFGMAARRFFWITDVPPGATRAGHGHRHSRQLIFVMSGSVEVDLVTPYAEEHTFELGTGQWLYLPARHVITLRDFAPDTILGVLATEPYDPDSFILPAH